VRRLGDSVAIGGKRSRGQLIRHQNQEVRTIRQEILPKEVTRLAQASLAFEVLAMMLDRGAPVPFRDIIAAGGPLAVRRRVAEGSLSDVSPLHMRPN
jgi:hypothetical protein